MSESTTRDPGEIRLTNRARTLKAQLDRWEARREEAERARDSALADLTTLWEEACARFGLELPKDSLLLDVLESITIDDSNNVWRWRGLRNNKGLATLRVRGLATHFGPATVNGHGNGEVSVTRWLAVVLGVIDASETGMLFPAEGYDTDDVNPWHKVLRASEKPIGNPSRFAFS